MVEKTGLRNVTDMRVEIQEEEVPGYRMVWKQVKEPCTRVVKAPFIVNVTKQVPYTWYEPEKYRIRPGSSSQMLRKPRLKFGVSCRCHYK